MFAINIFFFITFFSAQVPRIINASLSIEDSTHFCFRYHICHQCYPIYHIKYLLGDVNGICDHSLTKNVDIDVALVFNNIIHPLLPAFSYCQINIETISSVVCHCILDETLTHNKHFGSGVRSKHFLLSSVASSLQLCVYYRCHHNRLCSH